MTTLLPSSPLLIIIKSVHFKVRVVCKKKKKMLPALLVITLYIIH
jgi:hypothetical protein